MAQRSNNLFRGREERTRQRHQQNLTPHLLPDAMEVGSTVQQLSANSGVRVYT